MKFILKLNEKGGPWSNNQTLEITYKSSNKSEFKIMMWLFCGFLYTEQEPAIIVPASHGAPAQWVICSPIIFSQFCEQSCGCDRLYGSQSLKYLLSDFYK